MKQKVLNKCVSFIQSYYTYSDLELEKLKYGLEGIYLTLTKTLIILVLALLLGTFKETLLTIVLFAIIRFFCFGFHAEKSYQCLIISIIEFNLLPLLILNIDINYQIIVIICLLAIGNFLIFAPADTVKRPLPNKKKRVIRKTFSVIIGIIYSLVILFFDNNWILSSFLTALIIAMICVNPIIYMLFKQPFNNYKTYSRL